MEITPERFAELILAERDCKRLRDIIASKANDWRSLDSQELRIIQRVMFPQTIKEDFEHGEA